MDYFKYRPLALFSVCFLFFGFILSEAGGALSIIALFVALPLTLGATLLRRKRRLPGSALNIAAAAALASVLVFFAFTLPEAYAEGEDGSAHNIKGYVTDRISLTEFHSSYEIRLTELDNKSSRKTIRIHAPYQLDLALFEEIEAEVVFGLFEEDSDGFPEARIMRSRGIFISAEVTELVRTKGEAPFILTLPARLQSELSTILARYIGGDEGGLTSALLLGERERLAPTLKRDLASLGLSHILSLSGMHLTIILGTAEVCLLLFRVPKKLRSCLVCIFAFLYMILVGMPLSAVRSALMYGIFRLAAARGELGDRLSALLVSAALICIISPNALEDCALRLSFSAMLGIIIGAKSGRHPAVASLREKGLAGRLAAGIIISLAVSISALIFTLPFTWMYFGYVSVMSPLLTPLFSCLTEIILIGAPAIILLSPFPQAAALPAALVKLTARLMEKLAGAISSPEFVFPLDYPFVPVIIAFVLTVSLVLALRRVRSPGAYIALCASGVLTYAICHAAISASLSGVCDITLASRASNEMLAISSGGETVLCDLTDGSRSIIRRAFANLSDSIHSDRVDAYLLTHYHRKHLSSLDYIAERKFLSRILLPTPETEDEAEFCALLLEYAGERGIEYEFYLRGEAMSICGVSMTVSQRNMLDRSSHPRITIEIEGRDERVIYAGGAADELISELEEGDTVILGLHGPKIKDEIDISGGFVAALSEEILPHLKCRAEVIPNLHTRIVCLP